MIKNYELTVSRREALDAGLLFDVSYPAQVYGGSVLSTAITRTLWHALAHAATFDDGDERIIELCSQTGLFSSRHGPSATVNVPGLQVRFMSFFWRGGRWVIRVIHHLAGHTERVCTLCPAAAGDLECCAEVLFRYQGPEVTSQMYRALGLPAPDASLTQLSRSDLWWLPIKTAPELSLTGKRQRGLLSSGKTLGRAGLDSSPLVNHERPERGFPGQATVLASQLNCRINNAASGIQ